MRTHSSRDAGCSAATSPRGRASRGLAAVALLLCGCAYFNTLYNAKQLFKKAEIERGSGVGGGAGNYQACIDKCLLLLKYYPKSKYVDDALFLIGTSHLYRGEYVQARASYEDLVDRFPKSVYAERCYYNMGIAALRQGDAAGAAQAFTALQERFPQSKLNVEAVFRTAEAHLDSRDYDRAREEIRAFMRAHPDSRLVPEAQLRLARTYYEETRYEEARREYQRVLEHEVSPEVRFEAELNSALSLRAQAERVLEDPALRAAPPQPAAAPAGAPADSARSAAGAPGAGAVAPAEPDSVSAAHDAQRRVAEEMLSRSSTQLQALRKPAARLARQTELDIHLAVTRALQGQPDAAIATLDQIARAQARNSLPTAAEANFQIGEIHRRLGHLDKAREAYDAVQHLQQNTPLADRAQKKSAAIVARAAAIDRLQDAPETLRLWRAAHGLAPGSAPFVPATGNAPSTSENPPAEAGNPGDRPDAESQPPKPGDEDLDLAHADADTLGLQSASPESSAANDRGMPDLGGSNPPRPGAQNSSAMNPGLQRPGEESSRPGHGKTVQGDRGGEKGRALHIEGLPDSLGSRVALESQFEDLASQLQQVAEIDLLELDQPLVALREFEAVLEEYPGSLQGPRAAFAVAWIYGRRLRDPVRARQAYARVVRDYPGTPQGREASAILERPAQAAPDSEVLGPSSQP